MQKKRIIIALITMLVMMPTNLKDESVLDVLFPAPTASPSLFVVAKVTSAPIAKIVYNPNNLVIPTINLNAKIYPVGLDKSGSMSVPPEYGSVGEYIGQYQIGSVGSSVIDGHVDSRIYGEAVFFHLKDLHIGDKVFVDNLIFSVIDIQTYEKDSAPVERIFGNNGYEGLNLITCTGVFDKEKYGGYNKRLVIYCKLEK